MLKKLSLLLLALVMALPVIGASSKISSDDAESALKRLDKELNLRDEYIARRKNAIEELRAQIKPSLPPNVWLDRTLQLADMYRSFNNDSALSVLTRGYNRAIEVGDSAMMIKMRVRRAVLLPLSGFTIDAMSEYESIDPATVPDSLKAFYHESGRQLYTYQASFFENYPDTYKYWMEKAKRHLDAFLECADPATELYTLDHGESLILRGEYAEAHELLSGLVERLSDDSNIYARASHMLASIASHEGKDDEKIYYLAQSAAADTRGAVLEVVALQELGCEMQDNNDIDRAYNYLSMALSNAVECKAQMRILQSSETLPIIQRMHNESQRRWHTRLIIFIVVLALMVIAATALLFTVHRQVKKMKRLQLRLEDSNRVKEVYISQFFRLCSIYIDKLNQFCKIANRKISAGQVDEFYKMTKSGKLVEEQSEEFYKLFDDAFLHIYPTFVEDVNALLSDKIVLKEGELLNNDLRILAFMRLGLEDTNQVAVILNYSVNTIYAYRNKLRNRAIDRDNFEANIMKIGTV